MELPQLWVLPHSMPPSGSRADAHEWGNRLLAYALQSRYGVSLADLEIRRGEHGKPFFADFPARFNLSHTDGLICCGLGEEEIGVDCEKIGPWSPRIAERICTAEEAAWLAASPNRDAAFSMLWTLKESRMKLSGEGISMGFQNASFGGTVRALEKGFPAEAAPGITAKTFFSLPGYVLSVCCRGPAPQILRLAEEDSL